MQGSKLRQSLALANLVNLGHAPDTALDIAADWNRRQFEQSLGEIDRLVSRLAFQDSLGGEDGAHLFISFHFSVYPQLYAALAPRNSQRTVFGLIGEQSTETAGALRQFGARHDVCLEFVQAGPRMVRQTQRALAAGCSVVLLADIPWSRQPGESAPDASYPVPGGQFQGMASLERLARLIDPRYQVVVPRRAGERVVLQGRGHLPFPQAFAEFGEALRSDPADYERLDSMHKFFTFDAPRDVAVLFTVGDERYAVHSRTMRAWQVSAFKLPEAGPQVSTDADLRTRLSRLIGEQVDHVAFV